MKATLDSLDGVEDSLHEHYTQQSDGSFRLAIEGPVPGHVPAAEVAAQKATLAEFRQNNTDMKVGIANLLGVDKVDDPVKELQEHLARYDGVDPEEFQKLQERAKALEAKGVTQPADLAGLVAAQVKQHVRDAVKPIQAELSTERKARVEAETAKADGDFRDEIWGGLLKLGARPECQVFLLGEARGSLHLDSDGKIEAKPGKVDKDGDALTLKSWAGSAINDFDFAFGESSGGDRKQRPGGHVPGVRELVNPTAKQLGSPKNAKLVKEGKLKIVHK